MRGWSIALFRLAGIRLEMHATFLLLLAYVAFEGWRAAGVPGLAASVLLVLLVFACVVLHELGHSLTARRFGIGVSRIVLLPFGGMALFDAIPRQPRRELAIAAAGPAVNFVLVALFALVGGWPRELDLGIPLPFGLADASRLLLLINLIMGVFNLLPIFPMDGGRILRALLAVRLPYLRATFWAARAGQALAVAGMVAALAWQAGPLTVLLLAFVFLGAELELRQVRRSEQFDGLTVGEVLRRDFVALPGEAPVASALAALRHTHPQDVLVIEGNAPWGVVFREDLTELARAGRLGEPLNRHARQHGNILQTSWPLAPFAQDAGRGEGVLFPVYDGAHFAGVLDLRQIEDKAALARAARAIR